MDKHETFLEAIKGKKIVTVKVDTLEKGIIVRKCIPFDFGDSKIGGIRYHFLDLETNKQETYTPLGLS